jgi:hypothetical protein
MQIDRASLLVRADDVDHVVEVLSTLFGPPSVHQSGIWAQFDVAGARIAVATGDQAPTTVGFTLKTADLEEAAAILSASGWACDGPTVGDHEERVIAVAPEGWSIIAYRPLDASRSSRSQEGHPDAR